MTRLLEPSGARIVAVEPVPAMRDRLARAAPTVEVIDGVAEATTLSPAAADAVIVAQAFHWFDGAAALIEFARLLRPSGRLAIVFNRLDDRADLVVGLRSLFERYVSDGDLRTAADQLRRLTGTIQEQSAPLSPTDAGGTSRIAQ